MMKIDKVRELDTAELENKAKEIQEQMFRLKFQMGMGQVDGLKTLREVKRDRARVLTVINQRKKEGK